MNVLIIGGGASGMMAALTAAQNGHCVTLLERQARVGRKLLSTGNGRCNLTNLNVSPAHYHGEAPSFADYALQYADVASTLRRFADLGLLTVTEDSGRVYPYSNMAGSVLDVLRFALEQPHIDLHTGVTVTRLRKKGELFTAETESGETFTARRVILAAGGAAGSKVGGVMDGYRLAKGLGHHRTALYPSLVQLKTDPTYPRSLKGVKADARIRILRGGEAVAGNRGEILFTEYGVSGPAVFDISRRVSTGGDGLICELNFFPDWDERSVLHWHRRYVKRPASPTSVFPPSPMTTCAAWRIRPPASRCPLQAPAASIRRRSPQADCAPTSLTPPPWKAALSPASTPAARCWTSTATAAAIISSGHGPAACWQANCGKTRRRARR